MSVTFKNCDTTPHCTESKYENASSAHLR